MIDDMYELKDLINECFREKLLKKVSIKAN